MMTMLEMGEKAREAAGLLALATTEEKNKALCKMADAILKQQSDIINANHMDMQLAKQKNMPASFLDRLMLDAKRIASRRRNNCYLL